MYCNAAPEAFRIPKFRTPTSDRMCSGPLGHCEALVTGIAKRRRLLESVTALSPWTPKIESTNELQDLLIKFRGLWFVLIYMIPKNASGFIKEDDELKPEQPWLRIQLQHLTSRTRPSGSFILFEDIKHVLTLTSEQSYFAAVDLSYCPPPPYLVTKQIRRT